MTFLEALQAHKGGLVLLKSELWWYGGRDWDGITGRVCLLMDSAARYRVVAVGATAYTKHANAAAAGAAALLLLDGCPCWVWVAQSDVELL
jgi:hypothetical protein